MWEEFRSLALPILGEHFPPELIEDNGDSLVFIDRRSLASFFVTENARGLTIGRHEERNTVGTFFTSPSIELATIALTLLAREGLAMILLAALSSWLAMRKVAITPLGVARRSQAGRVSAVGPVLGLVLLVLWLSVGTLAMNLGLASNRLLRAFITLKWPRPSTVLVMNIRM